MQKLLITGCILFSLIWISGCSVPKLGTEQCVAARDTVKRFYSVHFGNEVRPAGETAQANDPYLTERLAAELAASPGQVDYFTQTENFPKAFRVGSCESGPDGEATFQVVLLWRDDTRNDQSEVKVTTVLSGDRWLIDRVAK